MPDMPHLTSSPRFIQTVAELAEGLSYGDLARMESTAREAIRPTFARRVMRVAQRLWPRRSVALNGADMVEATYEAWADLDDDMDARRYRVERVLMARQSCLEEIESRILPGTPHRRHEGRRRPPEMGASAQRPDIVMIARAYPHGADPYAGAFVRSRAEQLSGLGLRVVVCIPSSVPPITDSGFAMDESAISSRGGTTEMYSEARPQVMRGSLVAMLGALAMPRGVSIHSPTAAMMSVLHDSNWTCPLVAHFHGFEARDWSRLVENYNLDRLDELARKLEPFHALRMALLHKLAADPRVSVAFVSTALRDMAIRDSGAVFGNALRLPNPVDPLIFPARDKVAEDRFQLLLLRPFTRANYAADLGVEAIRKLLVHDTQHRFQIHVQGFGKVFKPLTARLTSDAVAAEALVAGRLTISEGLLAPHDLAALHARSGILLYPSRHDSQGVSLCEAMSGGVVPVAHRVGGVGEFIAPECGVALDSLSPQAMADEVMGLANDPARFLTMSRAAAHSMRKLCGPQTLHDELVALDIS